VLAHQGPADGLTPCQTPVSEQQRVQGPSCVSKHCATFSTRS